MWQNSRYSKRNEIQFVMIGGMDYDIGYTLLNPLNPNEFFTCINGPLSPNKKGFRNIEKHDIDFKYLLDCIRNNRIYNVDERKELYAENEINIGISNGKMAACAFR